jgi:iodotyrosine deiodinase
MLSYRRRLRYPDCQTISACRKAFLARTLTNFETGDGNLQPHDTLPYTELPDYSDAERIARSRAFYDAIKTRRTCRYFTDDAIPRAVIENAILAAGTAPNGANHQPWHFAVIESPEKKKALRAAAEEEERAFYESKGSGQWLEALAPLGTDADKPFQ